MELRFDGLLFTVNFPLLNRIVVVQVCESSTGRFEGNDGEKRTNAGNPEIKNKE